MANNIPIIIHNNLVKILDKWGIIGLQLSLIGSDQDGMNYFDSTVNWWSPYSSLLYTYSGVYIHI